jgi:hypothetical protein
MIMTMTERDYKFESEIVAALRVCTSRKGGEIAYEVSQGNNTVHRKIYGCTEIYHFDKLFMDTSEEIYCEHGRSLVYQTLNGGSASIFSCIVNMTRSILN